MAAHLREVKALAAQTTDATQTTLGAYTLPANSVGHFEVSLSGFNVAGSLMAAWRLVAFVRRTGGGAVLVGVVPVVTVFSSVDTLAVAWAATLDVSGNDVRVRVTGALATTIEWTGDLSVILRTP